MFLGSANSWKSISSVFIKCKCLSKFLSMTFCLWDRRVPYVTESDTFSESCLAKDPISQFETWFKEAQEKCRLGFEEVNGVCLSTATLDGRPSSRMVLLKAFGPDGFQFFTNLKSRKSQELSDNPFAAMLFYWPTLHRQVRIEGKVELLSDSENEAYWAKRPVNSQASAVASEQSSVVESRAVLQRAVVEILENTVAHGVAIPKPPHWGGYVLRHDVVEFWQGHSDRLHDRLRFRRALTDKYNESPKTEDTGKEQQWICERLAP